MASFLMSNEEISVSGRYWNTIRSKTVNNAEITGSDEWGGIKPNVISICLGLAPYSATAALALGQGVVFLALPQFPHLQNSINLLLSTLNCSVMVKPFPRHQEGPKGQCLELLSPRNLPACRAMSSTFHKG